MIVMDETTNMVDVARFFMEFCMDESCGKCIPCRAGTVQMHRLLTRIGQGGATRADLETAGGALRHGQAHEPVRPRPDGAQPRAEHAALLPRRVRGAAPAPDRVPRPVRRPTGRPLAAQHAVLRPQRDPTRGRRDHGGQDADDRRQARHRPRGPDAPRRRRARPASRSRRCATSTGSPTSAPAGSAWSRSRGRSRLLPACVTARRRGHGGPDRHRAAPRVSADDRRAALRRAQPRLLGLRRQRQLRAAGPGRSPSAWTTSGTTT